MTNDLNKIQKEQNIKPAENEYSLSAGFLHLKEIF
ncbi:hypothetical protein IKK_02605 [Bacillus mycoides]|nr:hypothetical protein IKK_02605 [Bacillus mycoides]